ncbi:MAG TPA: two-component regulator propeller domain-containing protein [Xanthomonadaceae bacterium]|jgi:signal transduction histidine kinase/CheY-like chemotaxis protein/streptogramin lyase
MRRTILSCLLWTLVGIACAAPPEVARVRAATAAAVRVELPETPRLRMYGVSDGLPSSSVNAIAQDARGYLWLATDDGLARFDGIGFKVWRHDPADPASLPGNLVQALHVDAQDRVWAAMEGHGMAMLLPDGVHFRRYGHDNTPAMGEDDVFSIDSTPDGALWFGSFGGGLYRMDAHGAIANWQPRKDDPRSLPDENVFALAVGPRGELWVATTAGAARWTGRDFERVDAPGVKDELVFAILPEADGRTWFATKAGLFLRAANGSVRAMDWNPGAGDPRVTGILRDRHGGWWLSIAALLRRREPESVANAPALSVAIPGTGTQRVMGMLQDREGSVWFATKNGGLAQLVSQALRFASFAHDGARPDSPSATQPEAIARAGDGRLWVVGGHSAIDRLDPATGAIEHWSPPELAHKYLWALSQRGDGPLWIGYNTGVARADPRTRKLQAWDQDSAHDAPLSGPNDLIAQTPDGRVWISSLGVGIQARSGDGRVLFSIKPGDDLGLTAADTEQLGVSPQGALWLSNGRGLFAWNDAAHRFAPVPGSPTDRIYGFAFADARTLWLHRLGGLERYGWDGHALDLQLRVDEKRGLPAVESGGVIADARGDVWLTTVRGLLRFDPGSGRVRMYGVRDGLPSQEFGRHPPLLTPDGIAAAGTVDGLVLFEPAKIPLQDAKPPLAIDTVDVRRGDRSVPLDPRAGIELGPDDRDLRVSARLLSYADPKANDYRFLLHGYDAGWIDGGASGERVFSRLDPGRYALSVQAASADGVWSTVPDMAIVVHPPWWKTRLAYAAYAAFIVCALLLMAWLYRRRLRQRHAYALAEQRSALAEQNSEAKSRFLATMGHEIRTPMTGVLGMTELLLGSELASNQREQAESIQRAGQHLLRIVNDALDLARIEAGKLALDVAPFDPCVLLREVDALLHPQAAAKRIAFDCHVVADVPRGLRGDAARVRQILLNLGNNAIKFTERGSVRIVLTREPQQGPLRVTVVDTGPGMNAQQVERLFERFEQGEGARAATRHGSSGLGLAICRELAAAMGGTIAVESTPGVGTRFDVLLPLPEAEPPLAAAEPSARAPAQALRLLLVEDDPIVAEVLQGLLRLQGHEVVHAQHGLAALSELDNARFDAALLDLDLPGVNGLDLARLIRARGMRLPLLAVTARADATAESDARAAGMDGFLRKPVTGELLGEALERLVGR